MKQGFDGIVLFHRPHREKDALVKIFTKEFGTKMFFVRDFNKANHSYKAQLIPLTHNYYLGTLHQEGLSFISESHTLHSFKNLQVDPYKMAIATYISQLTDASLPDNQPSMEIYDLFLSALSHLNQDLDSQIVAVYCEIALLKQFGVQMNFHQCVVCGSFKQPFDFSIKLQGSLCQEHQFNDDFRLHLDPKALYIVSLLSQISMEQINTVKMTPQTYGEIRRLMDSIYNEFVGIQLRSKSYLDKLMKFENTMMLTQGNERELIDKDPLN